jgi:hypothetical protein
MRNRTSGGVGGREPRGSLLPDIATRDWFDTHMRFSANPVFVKIAFDAFVPRSYTTVVLTVTLVGLQDARRQETVAL